MASKKKMNDNKYIRYLREGNNLSLSVLRALDVFEETGRREQFVAVLDQIEAFEKEYGICVEVAKPVSEYTQRLKNVLKKAMPEHDQS